MLGGVGPPWFSVSVASKGLSSAVSLLESRVRVSVAFNRVRRIPMGLREMAFGEGRAGVKTCGRRGPRYGKGCEKGEDNARRWNASKTNKLYNFHKLFEGKYKHCT